MKQPQETAGKPVVHMIGNAHIDAAWLWRWEESLQEVHDSFRSALDRMNEYPEFTFIAGQVVYYDWVQQNWPEMYEEIKARVREGRWEIAGGWWVQPDDNIPSGESFIRQGLYAQRFLQREFGVTSAVGYNPDTFGHNRMLPQIYAQQGIGGFVFFRPGPHEKKLPGEVFWWQSPDGTKLLTARPPHHYGFWGQGDQMSERIRQAAEQTPPGLGDVACFYGVGNHGGGPTIENIKAILQAGQEKDAPPIQFGRLDNYIAAIRAAAKDAPVLKDDLQHHASGCYAVHSEVKRRNRKCEQLLITAEKLGSLAACANAAPYPLDDLTQAWKNVLFNQFHDILAGTSIPEVYEDANAMYDEAEILANGALDCAVGTLAADIDTTGGEIAVIVFNPHSWEVRAAVEAEIPWDHKLEQLHILDDKGKEVLWQQDALQVPTEPGRLSIVFDAKVPPLGYRAYLCKAGKAEVARGAGVSPADVAGGTPAPRANLWATDTTLENRFWHLEFDPTEGQIIRLYDRINRAELLDGPANALLVIEDKSDTWSHDVFEFREVIGAFGNASVRLVDCGPLRAAIEVQSSFGASRAYQDIILYRDSPVIEFRLTLDWHEQHKALKAAFPFAVAKPKAIYEIPFGYIERPCNGEEEPGQQWIEVAGQVETVAGKSLDYGISLLNDSKYGFDVKDGEMRMTILRSPIFAFHDPRQIEPGEIYQYIDQGVQEVTYALLPHSGAFQDAGTVRHAQELNSPVISDIETPHEGPRKRADSFLTLKGEGVIVSAVKVAEEGQGMIVRLYETDGKGTEVEVGLKCWKRTWKGKLKKHEIVTLRFDKGAEPRVVNALEM
jgi:alpha-mannosidase